MGKKLDEAYYRLSVESNHHIRLSQARADEYENGFASGFVEALRIVQAIRDGKIAPVQHPADDDDSVFARSSRRARGRRGRRQ